MELPRLRQLSRLLRQSADRPCWYSWPVLLERTAPVAVNHTVDGQAST
jgi:hypothetical protein